MQYISQAGRGQKHCGKLFSSRQREEGFVHSWRSERPRSSTKLTNLPLFPAELSPIRCLCLSLCISSAQHTFLFGLIHCQAVSLRLRFYSSIFSSAYLSTSLSVSSLLAREGETVLIRDWLETAWFTACTVTSDAWDGRLMLRWSMKHYTLSVSAETQRKPKANFRASAETESMPKEAICQLSEPKPNFGQPLLQRLARIGSSKGSQRQV